MVGTRKAIIIITFLVTVSNAFQRNNASSKSYLSRNASMLRLTTSDLSNSKTSMINYNSLKRIIFSSQHHHPILFHQNDVETSSTSLSLLSSVSKPSSTSLYSSFNTVIEPQGSKKDKNQSTTVYALILTSIISFLADNILHLKDCRKLYFYHKNWRWWQPLTSTFCHTSRQHLSNNLFLLLLFGRSVEDELGSFGLLFSYIFCGVLANLISLVWLPRNTVSIGASGAVYGLFAVSICSRLSWRDVLSWRKILEVGVLGQWVVTRVFDEAKTAVTGGIEGVNHVAHLAGAFSGILMVLLLRGIVLNMEKKELKK